MALYSGIRINEMTLKFFFGGKFSKMYLEHFERKGCWNSPLYSDSIKILVDVIFKSKRSYSYSGIRSIQRTPIKFIESRIPRPADRKFWPCRYSQALPRNLTRDTRLKTTSAGDKTRLESVTSAFQLALSKLLFMPTKRRSESQTWVKIGLLESFSTSQITAWISYGETATRQSLRGQAK